VSKGLSLCVLVASASVAYPLVARAQDASREAIAQGLFEEAVKLLARGDYNAACPKLASSQSLDPAAGTALDLAACYEKLGRTASAWAVYGDAETLAARSCRRDWAARARRHEEALAPKLGRIAITLAPGVAAHDVRVTRDEVAVDAAAFGLALPADPGDHVVAASAAGKTSFSVTVHVAGDGDRRDVVVPVLEDAPVTPPPVAPTLGPAPEPPAMPPASAGSTRRAAGIAIGGVGVAGLALGAVLGFQAKSVYDQAHAQCPAGFPQACGSSAVSSGQTAYNLAYASTVAFVVGGFAVAEGVFLFVTSRPGPAARGVAFAPFVGAGEAGLAARGAW